MLKGQDREIFIVLFFWEQILHFTARLLIKSLYGRASNLEDNGLELHLVRRRLFEQQFLFITVTRPSSLPWSVTPV